MGKREKWREKYSLHNSLQMLREIFVAFCWGRRTQCLVHNVSRRVIADWLKISQVKRNNSFRNRDSSGCDRNNHILLLH